ncbi:hypothetical protein [Marisediminicola senii]|uniref:hypothetical protein n=1 Tax=Marisediminicola senii TaxID=2711233 RepID=UPI0013EDB655|nr:hypothetical protein [Marisediminicola senii]
MQPVDAATLPGLSQIIGADRFAPYLSAQGGSRPEAMRLYMWNVEASAALLGAYAAVEVGVRNAMHNELSGIFGRADWWSKAPLGTNDFDYVKEAESYLNRRKLNGQWGPGHVVAELKTSFWEGLLVNKYHASLWERGLKHAFPHYQGRRDSLRQRMERLRMLRNRAAHHEPIFARDLNIDHQFMCDLASFIEPDLQTWVSSHSRLPSIVSNRAATILGNRYTRF